LNAALGASPTSQVAIQFEDVTKAVGLTGMSNLAAAWGDYDNDGWVDLYVAGQLWRNEGGRRFTRVDQGQLANLGIWGDYDNDGYRDLFCWREWKVPARLYHNDRGRRLVQAAKPLPKQPMQRSRGAAWGDFNNDGFLDIYEGGYEHLNTRAPQPDAILTNDRKGGFRLTWKTPGRPQPARGVTAADYDEDGDLDVYVSNYRLAPNLLWENDGQGRFTNVAAQRGVDGDGQLGAWGHTIGSAWGDLDNDGHLDLFVGNFSHSPAYQDRPKFYRNLGPGRAFAFEDKSGAAGLAWQESFASPALGDFDNDGDLDLLFTTVYPRDHCVLYRNDGGWSFTDVTARSGISAARTYQAALADYDNDGDLDLVTGGKLLRNNHSGGHWLKVRLEGDGRAVNRDAVGACVRIVQGQRVLARQVASATGEGNQNDLTLHFGLGRHAGPVTLVIRWPGGATQTHRTPPDRTVLIRYRPKESP